MKRLIIIGVVAMSASACTGGAGAASATVAVPPATTVAAVDTVAATTTSPSTSSTSTTSSTTITTLTETTTTVVPTEALIKQAVQDYTLSYHLCGATPVACVPESFTAKEGHSRSTVTELSTGLTAQGLYFSTDLRGSYLVAESVTIESSTEATALFCVFDAGLVMGPTGPDGQPTVVNDQILSLRNEYRLFLEDGLWKVGEQLQLDELGQGDRCPPAA
jgi:hypothetical protein